MQGQTKTLYTFNIQLSISHGIQIYTATLCYKGQKIHQTTALSQSGAIFQIKQYHQRLTQKIIQQSFLTA